jgi:2-succinyl-6-hydroxy-2,4-cyclohexadiene-1-carboxylate synthase
VKLHAERWGRGPQTLLLLHGFTGDHSTWSHLEAYWGDSFQVVAVDLPGHGRSPPPSRSGLDGFQESVDALGEVLQEGPPAAVVGYSLGARLALALALANPGHISRMVLESGSPGLRRRKARMARRRDDESLAGFIEERGVPAFVEHWEALPLFETLRKLPPATQENLRARRLSARPEGLASALRALGSGVQPSLWHLLPALRVPTLLVTGAMDPKFTAVAHEMAKQLPLAWFCTLAAVGHAPHLEAPAAYAHEVQSFFQTPWFDPPLVEGEERRPR